MPDPNQPTIANRAAGEVQYVLPTLDDEEQAAMDQLVGVMRTIVETWGMRSNGVELASAAHVIQGFIVQHMLHRLVPDQWSDWARDASR